MSKDGSAPHARFTARAASLRSASLRRRLIIAGSAVLVLLLIWVVWFSPLLAVRSVRVEGADGDLSGSIRSSADDQVGLPLLRVDTDEVVSQVGGLAEVRSVAVSRGWPSTLKVQVRQRTPVVVVESDGQRQLVDATGLAYAKAGAVDARRLPVVRLDSAKVSGQDAAAAARVMAAVPQQDRDQVSDLRVDSSGQVSFTIDGLKVAWGSSARSAAKGKALATMRPIAEKENSSTLDVSSPSRPVLG